MELFCDFSQLDLVTLLHDTRNSLVVILASSNQKNHVVSPLFGFVV